MGLTIRTEPGFVCCPCIGLGTHSRFDEAPTRGWVADRGRGGGVSLYAQLTSLPPVSTLFDAPNPMTRLFVPCSSPQLCPSLNTRSCSHGTDRM